MFAGKHPLHKVLDLNTCDQGFIVVVTVGGFNTSRRSLSGSGIKHSLSALDESFKNLQQKLAALSNAMRWHVWVELSADLPGL